ncbi:MAG: Crp/Fnr family transcriptional regulator [Stenomitos rutilans HA7619-LM2]|jgi:CRP-like cAMP-binding protein|nr:Crp/Fnr family transcriptional regulator [Stenomitos rutilans HA7619-LM2]
MPVQTSFKVDSVRDHVKNTNMGKENYLLESFPPEAYQRLAPSFQTVFLEQGKRLHEPGDALEAVYFPIDCLLSITVTMSDGKVVETGVVGCREMLGINAFMGRKETTQTEYTVQISGRAIKLKAQRLQEEFDRDQELRVVLLRYTQAFIAQVSQTAACNSAHMLDQRLARWLLEAQSRIASNELKLTHEFIAEMLGVRRSGVTQAAQMLQDMGLIRYRRGHIHILNQAGLEARSCECFKTVKDEYDRLLVSSKRDLV